MKRKRAAILTGGILALGMALIVIGCSRTGEHEAGRSPIEEESAMKPENHTLPSPAAQPAIDAAAPQTFDTATFGLG
jgi:hypothetical protein